MKRFLILLVLLLSVVTLPAPTVNVSGNGSTNYFPIWRNGFSITTNSAVYQLSDQIGINTTNPFTKLTVLDTVTSSPRGIMSYQVNTGTDGARFHLRKARGTQVTPTTVVTGDTLGKIVATGYDGSSFLEMGSIQFDSIGTIASNRLPTVLKLWTATDAAPSVITESLRVRPTQIDFWPDTTVGFTVDRTALAIRAYPRNGTAGSVSYFSDNVNTSGIILYGSAYAIRSNDVSVVTRSTERLWFDSGGSLNLETTVTAAGTTTTQTINKMSGRVNIAAVASAVTVNNNLCTTNSLVFATIASNDSTATLKNVVSGTGSFVITLTAAANAETAINFLIINQ